jgi:membrane protease YdiL (CAAX protease family)
LVKAGPGIPAFNFGLIAQFGPSLAAIILIAATKGANGIQRIIKSLLNWRIGFWWLLLAIIFEPVMFILITVLYLTKSNLSFFSEGFIPLSNISILVLTFVIGIFRWGIAEEIGWSGWMLPKLQKKMSPFVASIILAFVTTLWHINPDSFISELYIFKEGTYLWGYYSKTAEQLVISIPITLVTVYIYNNTKGSLLAMILFHSASNSSYFWVKGAFGIVETEFYRAAFLIALVVIMILFSILVLYQKKKVTSYH